MFLRRDKTILNGEMHMKYYLNYSYYFETNPFSWQLTSSLNYNSAVGEDIHIESHHTLPKTQFKKSTTRIQTSNIQFTVLTNKSEYFSLRVMKVKPNKTTGPLNHIKKMYITHNPSFRWHCIGTNPSFHWLALSLFHSPINT